MHLRISIVCSVALALAAAGCRHAKPAAAPATVPAKAAVAPLPETKVAAPAQEFKQPAPAEQAAEAPANAAIRDAFFPFDSAVMTPESRDNLAATAQWLRKHKAAHVTIEGHCDERGTEQYNLALGAKRAYDAEEYLSALGIDKQRVSTISYGKEKPFDAGHDESAWAKNRRAHIVVTTASK